MSSSEPDNPSADALFEDLIRCVESENHHRIFDVVYALQQIRSERNQMPDVVLERVLALLAKQEFLESPLAASILFGFCGLADLWLTKRQGRRCLDSLKSLPDRFKNGEALWAQNEVCNKLLIAGH